MSDEKAHDTLHGAAGAAPEAPLDGAPDGLSDRMDDALRAFWNGASGALDELVMDSTADGAGGAAGSGGSAGVGGAGGSGGSGGAVAAAGTPHLAALFPVGRLDDIEGDVPPTVRNYRIIRCLGRGGMGVVYEAEQEHPQRRVALKVVLGRQRLDEHHNRLFQREIQTLARLRHPGIAALYEAGATDDGRHYFAMDVVEGLTLTEHVRTGGAAGRAMTIEQRLRLFCEVCRAGFTVYLPNSVVSDLFL